MSKPKNSKDALEFIHTLDSLAIKKQKDEIERLKAEVERLNTGIQPEGSNDAVGRAVNVLLEKEKEIARLKAEVERLTANTDKLCKHGDLEIARLQAEVERLTGELGELEGIRSYLKWNGLQADLKDWLDWRAGRNGSEIPFPKDYLPPTP